MYNKNVDPFKKSSDLMFKSLQSQRMRHIKYIVYLHDNALLHFSFSFDDSFTLVIAFSKIPLFEMLFVTLQSFKSIKIVCFPTETEITTGVSP